MGWSQKCQDEEEKGCLPLPPHTDFFIWGWAFYEWGGVTFYCHHHHLTLRLVVAIIVMFVVGHHDKK